MSEEAAFAAPWEANAFALRAHLVETGRLDAARFAALLGEELRNRHAPADDGTAYFVAFVTALERALAPLVDYCFADEQQTWREAAQRTPHGQPIRLPAKET